MKLSKVAYSACAAALAFAVVVPGTAQAEAACTWVMSDLPLPAGNDGVYGLETSADGVWAVDKGWGRTAVVWQGAQARLVKFREDTIVWDVSGTGTLAGNTMTQSFRQTAAGVREVLQPLPGSTGRTWITAINTAGEVAGTSDGKLVVWPADSSTPRALPDPDNRRGWTVRGIDEEGRVVAHTIIGGGDYVGYVWDRDGNRARLETLPGDNSVEPVAVRGGRVVGSSGPDSNVLGTVVEWGPDGKIVRTLPSMNHYAFDINARGDVVGVADGKIVVVRPTGETEPLEDGNDLNMADNGDVLGIFGDANGNSIPRRATCSQA